MELSMMHGIEGEDHGSDNFLNISSIPRSQNENAMINNWTQRNMEEKLLSMKLMKSLNKGYEGENKKLVLQSNSSTFKMIKSMIYSLTIVGLDCYPFEIEAKSDIKSMIITKMISIWHLMVQAFVIINIVFTFLSMILYSNDSKMSTFVSFIRLLGVIII